MNPKEKYFLLGFGSILDFCPDPNFFGKVYRFQSPKDDWRSVGDDLRRALLSYDELTSHDERRRHIGSIGRPAGEVEDSSACSS